MGILMKNLSDFGALSFKLVHVSIYVYIYIYMYLLCSCPVVHVYAQNVTCVRLYLLHLASSLIIHRLVKKCSLC